METRQITQVRIYVLVLNSIFDRCEGGSIVAISTDYDRLIQWYGDQECDMYSDQIGDRTYHKSFKKDSDLENFNPPMSLILNNVDHWNHGIHEEWVMEESLDKIFSRYNVIYRD